MEPEVSVKAPGKILWIGGYSVLERPNISYVSAVDAYVTANLRLDNGEFAELNAPQLKMSIKGAMDKTTGKVAMGGPKELLLFKTAAEVALGYVSALGLDISGFSITTNNDPAFAYSISKGKTVKSGLGSSAAVTVAAVGAVLKAFGANPLENDAMHKLSQIAHSIATGKVGSGFDIAAAAFGSIFYTRYSAGILKDLTPDYTNDQLVELVKRKWDYKIEKFTMPHEFRLLFANFGKSMITTGAIGSVSSLKARDPHIYTDLLDEINGENMKAVSSLRRIKNGESAELHEFELAFDRGRSLTKKLGIFSRIEIEPDDCSALIDESKNNGAYVAKLPGAGGKDAISAISLSPESHKSLEKFWKTKKELTLLKIKAVSHGAISE